MHATKRVLEIAALAALLRALFLAAVDAFAFHIFGDPRPAAGSRKSG